jgi:hypothetical protein
VKNPTKTVSVENPTIKILTPLHTREFTLKRNFMTVMKVGQFLVIAPDLWYIREPNWGETL